MDFKNCRVFLCSSGTGKSYLAQKDKRFIDMDIIKTKCHYVFRENVSFEELEHLKGDYSYKRNPEYPENYFSEITRILNNTNLFLLFVPTKLEKEYFKRNHIQYCLVYPYKGCEKEYAERFIKRGNEEKYSLAVAHSLEEFFTENDNDDYAKYKIILNKGEYLTDLFNKRGNDG